MLIDIFPVAVVCPATRSIRAIEFIFARCFFAFMTHNAICGLLCRVLLNIRLFCSARTKKRALGDGTDVVCCQLADLALWMDIVFWILFSPMHTVWFVTLIVAVGPFIFWISLSYVVVAIFSISFTEKAFNHGLLTYNRCPGEYVWDLLTCLSLSGSYLSWAYASLVSIRARKDFTRTSSWARSACGSDQ